MSCQHKGQDGIHILASESKHDSGKFEQDMLRKVSQANQDHNALNFSEGLALEKESEHGTSLILQLDAILNQSKMNHAYINKSVSLSEELVVEQELNMSMAPSGGACESVTNISCVHARDVSYSIKKPSDFLLATNPPLQSDSHLDSSLIDDNVDVLTIITQKGCELFCEEWNVPKSKGISVVIELKSAEISDISGNYKEVSITDEDLNGDDSECKIHIIPTLRAQPEICEECIEERESFELMRFSMPTTISSHHLEDPISQSSELSVWTDVTIRFLVRGYDDPTCTTSLVALYSYILDV